MRMILCLGISLNFYGYNYGDENLVIAVPKTTLYVLVGLLLKMKYTTTNHQYFSSLLILLNEDVRREIIK